MIPSTLPKDPADLTFSSFQIKPMDLEDYDHGKIDHARSF
jgi:hypothetical protein